MATSTPRGVRVKPTRTVRVALPPSDISGFAVVVIAIGKTEDTYHVTLIPSDFGTAFRVEKVSDPNDPCYEVCLEGNGGHCSCKGWCHRATCRHVEALNTLRNHGKL